MANEDGTIDIGEVIPPESPNVDLGSGAVPGQVYIRLADNATAGVASAFPALPIYNDTEAGIASAVTSTGIEELDAVLSSLSTSGLYRLVADDGSAAAVADVGGQTVPGLSSIVLVQFDETRVLQDAMNALYALDSVAEVSPVAYVTTSLAVDDPEFPQQWGLKDISCPKAWDTTTGDSSVVVAVVDTGCDAVHTDLAPILTGKSFIPGAATAQDDNGHGTHVAGTIAALGNNTTNVAGIAWGCWILPVKVLAAGGFAAGASVAQGIAWASAQKARIMNLSIQTSVDDLAMRIAVASAIANGVLVVAAMGNHGWTETTPSYPAAYPGVLAVGAHDQNHKRSIWSSTESSNQGSWITVVAPGTNILSLRNGGGTTSKSGTSMASPHVAGIAALLASAKPSLTASDILNAIYQSALVLQDNPTDPVPNPQYGGGRVDAAAALAYVLPAVGDFPTPPDDGTRVADAGQVPTDAPIS